MSTLHAAASAGLTAGDWAGIGYGAAFVLALRPVYAWARDMTEEDNDRPLWDDPETGLMVVLMTFLLSAAWPLFVLGAYMTFKPRKTRRELREEARTRERRVRELEREAGL